VAGYYSNLYLGLKTLGVNVDCVFDKEHPFGYARPGDKPDVLLRFKRWTFSIRDKTPRRKIVKKLFFVIASICAAFLHFISLIRKYDVFIFGFGLTLLPHNVDLPILKIFQKKIICNLAHGSESRPSYCGRYLNSSNGQTFTAAELLFLAKSSKMRQRWLEKYADIIIGAPYSTSPFSGVNFINSFVFGVPYSGSISNNVNTSENSSHIAKNNIDEGPVRILHSPSKPVTKGSELIRIAIENLQSKGYAIEFIELRDRPNSEVLQEIQNCDFVVDQLYSDTPLAGFATEAAWFGKPAVVGGYGLESLRKFIPKNMLPPSQICLPDNVEFAIEELIVNIDHRLQLGAKAQNFVRSKWAAQEAAKKFFRLITDDIPEDWWLNPKDVVYLHGCGLSEEHAKNNVRKLVQAYGIESLQLSHRPDLEKAFMDFAGIKVP